MHLTTDKDKYFPNDVSLAPDVYKDASLIPPEAFENAKLHKIKAYHWVSDLTFNGLRNAIYQNDVVIIGMDISDAWWTAPDGACPGQVLTFFLSVRRGRQRRAIALTCIATTPPRSWMAS